MRWETVCRSPHLTAHWSLWPNKGLWLAVTSAETCQMWGEWGWAHLCSTGRWPGVTGHGAPEGGQLPPSATASYSLQHIYCLWILLAIIISLQSSVDTKKCTLMKKCKALYSALHWLLSEWVIVYNSSDYSLQDKSIYLPDSFSLVEPLYLLYFQLSDFCYNLLV